VESPPIARALSRRSVVDTCARPPKWPPGYPTLPMLCHRSGRGVAVCPPPDPLIECDADDFPDLLGRSARHPTCACCLLIGDSLETLARVHILLTRAEYPAGSPYKHSAGSTSPHESQAASIVVALRRRVPFGVSVQVQNFQEKAPRNVVKKYTSPPPCYVCRGAAAECRSWRAGVAARERRVRVADLRQHLVSAGA